MTYVNEEQSLIQYKLIGFVKVNILSAKSKMVKIKASPEDIFYATENQDGTISAIPNIVPMESAFQITLVNSVGRKMGGIVGLVEKVHTFELIDGKVNLEFSYIDVTPMTTVRDLFEIKPIMSHLIVHDLPHGHFLGVCVQGDPIYVNKWISENLKIFVHGGSIYYKQLTAKISKLFYHNVGDQPYAHVLTTVIASTVKVPNMDELNEFRDIYEKYVSYPIIEENK